MSVEPNEMMNEAWTRWQGHVINGAFPLGRYLGCSDHSGVFLTRSAARPAEVAIKLVPTNRALAESQLPRWKRAGALPHPHLLRLLEWGGCQLDGLPYLYAVMEYADQTLAQLLLHRALTEDEAREMMLPALEALGFLHSRNLVQGQLKPANILVVGDQLKLASDTIRRVSELSTDAPSAYDPPEARYQGSSPAGDVWALGASLYEALARRPVSRLSEGREAVALPADLSAPFREVVARCLSLRPEDRPSITELVAWAGGRSAGSVKAAAIQPSTRIVAPPETAKPTPRQAAPSHGASQAARLAAPAAESPKPRAWLTVTVAAVVLVALTWTGVRIFSTHRTPAPPPPPAAGGSLPQTQASAASTGTVTRAPASAPSATNAGPGQEATLHPGLHEVIPDVPRGALRTIRGHIKVWVRVVVNQDGSVFAAAVDRSGPSWYFQRLAVETAKKWTFPPVDAPSRRLMQVRFDFSRDGTTGRAVALE